VWAGISAGVGEAITAPIAVLTTSWSMALEWLARRIPPRLREPRPAHHAPFVLREIVATNSIPSEAQRLDYFRYRIKVEKLLVDTIERYLDGLGIDTSTLREQSGNVIYNLGVMQGAGAAFNNDSGTVVAGPNAHLMRPPPPTQAAGGTPPPAGR
jgi:hypothetical protein